MKTKPPAEPPPLPSQAEALPAAPPSPATVAALLPELAERGLVGRSDPTPTVILPAWWPEVKQQAEAELERVLKDTPLRAEPIGYEHPGTLLIHVWDKVRGNARLRYVVQPFFDPGGEPGKLPSAFRIWLKTVLGIGTGTPPVIEFDGTPPPGAPPVIAGYVVIRHPHGWQVRTYDLTPEALQLLAPYETGRSGEMHRSDVCDLIANDIGRLPNDAVKVPL